LCDSQRHSSEFSIMIAAWILCAACMGDPLVISDAVVDAGTVRIGQPLVRRYAIRNTGIEPLTITELRSDCGCAAPRMDRRTLNAGETAHVEIEVNTLTQPPGPVRWLTVLEYRSGSTERRATLELTARLIREIELQPAALALVGQPGMTHDFVLTDRRPKLLAVTSVRTDSPHLSARFLPTTAGDPARRIRIELAATCPEGMTAETLRIATDDPNYPELRVPITISRKPKAQVLASPTRATIEAGGSVLVQLRGADGVAVELERTETGHPALTTRSASAQGSFVTLRIGLDQSKWDGQPIATEITAHFAQPPGHRLIIPVTVRSKDE
jgi:hypothetical protein